MGLRGQDAGSLEECLLCCAVVYNQKRKKPKPCNSVKRVKQKAELFLEASRCSGGDGAYPTHDFHNFIGLVN